MRNLLLAVAVSAVASMLGCGADSSPDEDVSTDGAFVTSSDDEVVDPADPPTSPDPVEDTSPSASDLTAKTTGGGGGGGAPCARRADTLSPEGLTFVLHVSKKSPEGAHAFEHLVAIKKYIRDRDIFMVEEVSGLTQRLHDAFPCNAIHYIAYPNEMPGALATGGLIDGIAVDWEGGDVQSPAHSVSRLGEFAHRIRAQGKVPSVVPAWPGGYNDADITKTSNMAFELAQIQDSCANAGAARFSRAAKALVHRFYAQKVGARNVGFEISMDSFKVAEANVGAQRAAECTRAAYGKGARAIYIYGNGPDKLVDYFHELGKMGVRKAR